MSNKANGFRVPTLAEADKTYGELILRRAELQAAQAEKTKEARDVEKQIAADRSPETRPGVAALLGDGTSSKTLRRQRLAEIRVELADIASALRVIEERIRDAKTPAVRKVIGLVRPEFDRRHTAMIAAMRALAEKHRDFIDLCDELDAEEVSSAHLGTKPFFLGEPADGHLARYIREAGHAI